MSADDRILFIGMGGGNDVFSTMLAMDALWRLGWNWREAAVAGVLSPFHRHDVEQTFIHGCSYTGPYRKCGKSKRYTIRRDRPQEISFVDARMAEMVRVLRERREQGVRDGLLPPIPFGVYGLDLSAGSAGLEKTMGQLGRMFNRVVLVDLGGDSLYRGQADGHVLSPMFDAMVLDAVRRARISSTLFIAGPGTDGELSPEALRDALSACQARKYPLQAQSVSRMEALYREWIGSYRPGRTIPMTIEAFHSAQKEIRLSYRARQHTAMGPRYHYFEQRIDPDLCRSFYLADPADVENPFAVFCEDPRDWFIRCQVRQWRTNNEANMEFLPRHGALWRFLTPSPLFHPEERMAMIIGELNDVASRDVCDGVWMFPEDWEAVCGFPRLERPLEGEPCYGLVAVTRGKW